MKDNFYNTTYIGNALNGLSQLGNWLSGGRADISISARCGYWGEVMRNPKYTDLLNIIDWTFEPIEGEGHCIKAYRKDPYEDFEFDKGGKIGLVFIKTIVYTICPLLAGIFYPYAYIKKVF